MIIHEPVQSAIWHCLNHYAYKDATFLAERLHSELDSDESLFILATCYYRSSQKNQAYWLLKTGGAKSPEARFLYAKCAYELERFNEAESAISFEAFGTLKNFDDVCQDFGEVACFVLQLIAKICHQTNRHHISVEASKRALKLNPFLWHSFADICRKGERPDPNEIFQLTSAETFATCQNNNAQILLTNSSFSELETTGNLNSTIPVDQCTPANVINIQHHNLRYKSSSSTIGGASLSYQHTVDESPFYNNFTPLDNTTSVTNNSSTCTNSNVSSENGVGYGTTPLRKQFKYLSTMGPTTPSFGVLPISPSESPMPSTPQNNSSTLAIPTLIDSQESQNKSSWKKLRSSHNISSSGLIHRRSDTPVPLSKQIQIFNQSGNVTPRTPNANTQNVRRSSRLYLNSNYSVKENNKSPNIKQFATPHSPPPRKTKPRLTKMNSSLNDLKNEKSKIQNSSSVEKERIETITSAEQKVLINNQINSAQTMAQRVMQSRLHSAEGLMSLLREIGVAYTHLAHYECPEAIKHFEELPSHHAKSSWVRSCVALAHFEKREYAAAANIFEQIHQKEPYRHEFMEIYSTCLWQLQKDYALSALAQDLMHQDKNSPVTWCVAGNCFSLHKEHDVAIKFFTRAVEIDPDYVYAYTLVGHELVITEELDKALIFFRGSILKDPRHYNAWFGIGTIYSKQERYKMAEIHYQHALDINPRNSVIMVHIGAMQYFLKNSEKALQIFNKAIALDPLNPLCKFHRGSMYFSMGNLELALTELEELKEMVPKESVVYYLIGKIYKKMGEVELALMHFSWATDLDPKGANNQIKEVFEINNLNPTGNALADLNIETDGEPASDDSTQAGNEDDDEDAPPEDGNDDYDSDNY